MTDTIADRGSRAFAMTAFVGILLGLGLGVGAAAGAGRMTIDPDLAGWSVYTPAGKQPASFANRNGDAIEVRADGAVSFLYTALPSGPHALRRLSWRWRIEQMPPPTDLGALNMDDRPLAVHVWFPKSDAQKSLWDGVVSAFGFPVVGNAITYVWGGTERAGSLLSNPYLDDAALIILRDADSDTGVWLREEVDPVADFLRAFGRPPAAPPTHIAISSDTDDKGGVAVGLIGSLELGLTHP